MSYKYSIDPYITMLKQSERKVAGYGFLAVFLLVLSFLAAGIDSDGAG
ncbi:hypothetical protein ACFPOU_23775 [Massilia jejuensis]|uniref:Uncharacterized protein n=1 Tax=Massilia jejuensis TaxID=648894 RepID=A0ABW0PN96_9BURK